MLNPPPQCVLDQIPFLYANEHTQTRAPDIVIHLHFFVGSCDWWIAEFDREDTFFGFANLGDDQCAEWGYVSLAELASIGRSGLSVSVIDARTDTVIGHMPLTVQWDENWQPRPFREVRWRKQS
jgi:hypothetical protein